MRFSTILPLLLAAGVAQAQVRGGNNGGQNNNGQNKGGQNNGQNNNGQNNNGQNNNNGGNNNALALNPNNVQDGSNKNGQANGAEAGQAASATDPANFINFCTGKTKTNGLQVRGGSCNGIVMGDMPASNRMVSAVFKSPKNGQDFQANSAIDFSVQIANLQAGSFTNPDSTYYSAPQALNGGQIVGHTHVTVQNLGVQNLNDVPNAVPNAEKFDFFKGINDNGNGQGLLTAKLAAGLPNGVYRVCSMTSSSNHAPVIMPVAQRGAQDDCIRFTVGKGNGGNNAQQGGNNGQNNNAQQGANKGQGQQGQQAANKGQGQQGGQGGNKQKGRPRPRPKFAARDFIA